MVFRPLRQRPLPRDAEHDGGSRARHGRRRDGGDPPRLTVVYAQEPAEKPPHASQPTTPTVPQESVATQLTLLKGLLDQGALTQAEFDAQKAKLLAA